MYVCICMCVETCDLVQWMNAKCFFRGNVSHLSLETICLLSKSLLS